MVWGWYQQRWKNTPANRDERHDDRCMLVMRSWTSTSDRTLVQSDLSSSSWTTTHDLIVPGWLRSTSGRRPSSEWTDQHAHMISTRSSMFGKCYRWRFCDVRSCQQLSWNWEMPTLKRGKILRLQPPETHWKHETPLSGCDYITWVTHELLPFVVSGI